MYKLYRNFCCSGIVIVSVLFAVPVMVQARTTDSETLLRAIAQMLSAQQSNQAIADYCTTTYPYLAEPFAKAMAKWQDKHTEILQKSIDIRNFLYDDVKSIRNAVAAENLILKINLLIEQTATKLVEKLGSYEPIDQRRICNRTALSILNGQWDIPYKHPDAYKTIMDYVIPASR